MSLVFLLLSGLTLAGAIAAVSLRNPIHCALALVASFAGLAALYLRLNAQFVGLAQLLVYIGAVAILIVFAILLTKGDSATKGPEWSRTWLAGLAASAGMCALLIFVFATSKSLEATPAASPPSAEVRRIGELLMSRYVLPLEIMGVLLTAGMIAAIVLALPVRTREKEPGND